MLKKQNTLPIKYHENLQNDQVFLVHINFENEAIFSITLLINKDNEELLEDEDKILKTKKVVIKLLLFFVFKRIMQVVLLQLLVLFEIVQFQK